MTMLGRINCAEATDRAPFYVLGALDPREAAEVREHLESCSRPHEEFAQLGGVVPYLAEAVPEATPSPELRERILAAVQADVRAGRRDDDAAERLVASMGTPVRQPAPEIRAPDLETRPTGADAAARADVVPAPVPAAEERATAAAAPTAEPTSIAEVRERRTRRPWGRWLLQAAAVLAIAALAGWNFLLQREASDARQRADSLAAAVAVRENEDARVASLGPVSGAQGASGFAVMPPSGTGYLVVRGLPAPPAGKTYQAWYLAGGEPRSVGVVEMGRDGLLVMPLNPADRADGVAVSLENTPGAERPSEVVLSGTFESAS